MKINAELNRREFLRITALAGGGLLVACGGGGSGGSQTPDDNGSPSVGIGGEPSTPAEEYDVGAFMRIDTDNQVTILVGAAEIGQGALTSLPMIVAEELDADWSKVRSELSPVAPRFNNPYYVGALQFTVASSVVRGYFEPQRKVGAAVRQMMVNAAAKRWNVNADSLRTESGMVIDEANGRSASYGELASAAAQEPIPFNPRLKSPDDYRIIGKSKQRLDVDGKVDGSFQYGIDVDIPDMLTAIIVRPPRFGGQALNYDRNTVMAVPGVLDVITILGGVAIVAEDYWAATKGRQALQVNWAELLAGRTDSQAQRNEYGFKLNLPGVPLRIDGSTLLANTFAKEVISEDYYFPYQAHAAMEPLNVVIDYRGNSADIWTGTQSPTVDKIIASTILGLLPGQLNFHVMPAGGGFGRRGNLLADFVRDAALVAKVIQRPLKLIWSREDDMKGGFYRPAAMVRVSAGLNDAGEIISWSHRAITQDITAALYTEELTDLLLDFKLPALTDLTDLENGMPYDIDNVLVDFHLTVKPNMPALWMRSVNKYTDVFAQETLIDKVAQQAAQDPYQFRRGMLTNKPRHRAVLDAVAQAASWGSPPSGQFQGIAVMGHWGSFVAQVVEVSVDSQRRLTVHRVVTAADCGTAINPDLVIAQLESAVIFALSSVLFGEIELVDGVVQQNNFDDYPVVRMYQAPEMETVLVNSGDNPGGVGELGVPCVGPALCNAIFAATGELITELPLKNLNFDIA
jgi:isoquinoline 1-oxidoreductase beta subunit